MLLLTISFLSIHSNVLQFLSQPIALHVRHESYHDQLLQLFAFSTKIFPPKLSYWTTSSSNPGSRFKCFLLVFGIQLHSPPKFSYQNASSSKPGSRFNACLLSLESNKLINISLHLNLWTSPRVVICPCKMILIRKTPSHIFLKLYLHLTLWLLELTTLLLNNNNLSPSQQKNLKTKNHIIQTPSNMKIDNNLQ